MAKKTKAAKPIKIKRMIDAGELWDDACDTNDLLTSAGIVLDKACSNEILGRVLFEGKDGKFYTVTVQAVIDEVSKGFVEDVLQEIESEKDAPEGDVGDN